jgi:hypothetical protein
MASKIAHFRVQNLPSPNSALSVRTHGALSPQLFHMQSEIQDQKPAGLGYWRASWLDRKDISDELYRRDKVFFLATAAIHLNLSGFAALKL